MRAKIKPETKLLCRDEASAEDCRRSSQEKILGVKAKLSQGKVILKKTCATTLDRSQLIRRMMGQTLIGSAHLETNQNL